MYFFGAGIAGVPPRFRCLHQTRCGTDTPSFLHEIANGLNAHEDYTLGGWGGRSAYDDPGNKPRHLTDTTISDDGDRNKMYWRWIPAVQNDFAARMDWAVSSSYNGANHQPKAEVVGASRRDVSPGQVISLDASPSTDPDGNVLTYRWWQYGDADSVAAKVSINNATSQNAASFVVPNEPGKQVHIILEVADNGTPNLTSYRRLIFTIR
ncbi:PKD domain-containing protein [Verrucosispora sp. WMMA2121]|uniref:PKD domain-containing protein n=1 Tax=Verrucosispora sp. WMMA2121 TaxID=3015164 RepID=UPI0022B61CED|nr:PKD domain-containing protein [Verrucosispora sp. WMMA2121]MCZ7421094.1 PKD domain-containing protein [Verrucosispora sp. WMMA2121]